MSSEQVQLLKQHFLGSSFLKAVLYAPETTALDAPVRAVAAPETAVEAPATAAEAVEATAFEAPMTAFSSFLGLEKGFQDISEI